MLNDEDNDRQYEIALTQQKPLPLSSIALAELLKPGAKFSRMRRCRTALTLASSHLQLHSTSWLKEPWDSADVYFPMENNVVSYDHPFLPKVIFQQSSANPPKKRDRSFTTLGIVLLELCFGTLLDAHPLWHDSSFPRNPSDPVQQQAVAYEWAEDVEEQEGVDYATAVKWCLRESPTSIADDKWREDFAQNVVQPLQRCYDFMVGKH